MNEINPFFSVIIPVYQSEKTLEACLESVLSQNEESYEIVLVDDGSTDGSGQLCDAYKIKYPSKITVIHKANEGPLRARIDAIKKARGDYLMFLDSDDKYLPGIFGTIKKTIVLEMPDIVIFNYFRAYQNNTNQISRQLYEDNTVFEGTGLTQLLEDAVTGEWLNSLWQKCIRRDLFENIDCFLKYDKMIIGEDKLLSLSLLDKSKKVVYLAECLYEYRITPQSLSHNFTSKHYENMAIVHLETLRYVSRWKLQGCLEKCNKNKVEYGLNYLYSFSSKKLLKKSAFSNYIQLASTIKNDVEFWRAFEECKESLSLYKRFICCLLKHCLMRSTQVCFYVYRFFAK